MSQKPAEIVICLGSSCFARGNRKTLNIIQQYIKDNSLEETVKFRGNHCFGKCHNGPVVKINDKLYENVSYNDIIDILEKDLPSFKNT